MSGLHLTVVKPAVLKHVAVADERNMTISQVTQLPYVNV